MDGWNRCRKFIDGGRLQHRRWYLIATAVIALALSIAILKPLLSARWSLIDDHESISYYDRSEQHGPSWFLDAVKHSEVGTPGESSRYRPAYYFFRIAETGLWHGSARFWWFAHVAKFAISLLLLMWALRRVGGVWENVGATLWLVGAMAWWGDIYCRLGPSEAYCVPALALYAWGATAAIQTMRSTRLPRYHAWCGAAIALGGTIAAGGKENFVFLLIPSAYLVVRARLRGSHRWITLGAAIQLGAGLFVAIATYVGVSRHGHVYKEDASPGGRIALMRAAARELVAAHWLVILVALVVTSTAVVLANKRRRLLVRQLVMPGMVIVLAFVVWLSQVAFYNGWPPHLGRYNFPGALAAPVAILACYVGAVRIARFFEPRAAVVLRVLAIIVLAWRVFHLDYSLHGQATAMRDSSTDVAKKINRVLKAARAHPTTPILLVANNVWAYEPVHAVQVFLNHAHVTNPVYMIQRFTPSQFEAGTLERTLSETMDRLARTGGDASLFPLTRPFDYEAGRGCVGVGFAGDTGVSECPAVATF